MNDETPNRTPWWETALADLVVALKTYLRRHAPALGRDHEDIVHDTLLALTQLVRNDPSSFPAAWFEPGTPARAEDRDYLLRLAYTIASRRVADRFRAQARAWVLAEHDADVVSAAPSTAPSAERQRLVTEMLRVCVGVLADLSEEDRALVSILVHGEAESCTRSDRDRQRLRRVRVRLLDALRARFGADLDDLLREQD
jgi:RNA polymerase sigma-70 factor (ECF subfamily)